MDAQRPYSTEPPPWYNDRDETPRGQRDPRYGDRYPDDARYGDDSRYGEDARRDDQPYPDDSRYGDDQRYRDAYVGGYPGSDSGELSFDVPDQRHDVEGGRPDRGDDERATRGGRRGMRSGLELPEDEVDQTREESPRYRTEMLDRGSLRRPADLGDLGSGPGSLPSASLATGSAAPGLLAPGPSGAPVTAMPSGPNPAGPASGPPVSTPAAPGSPPAVAPLLGSPSSTVYQAGSTPTQAIPTSAMPSSTSGGAPKEAYRARRSGVAGLLGTVAVVVEVLVLVKVLIDSVTAHPTNTGGVLAGVFALCGIPMIALGLYGLATGAAIAGGPNVGRAWLRTPLAYLPIGLILIIAAGLAA